ncbi:putative protease [Roseobacter sp. SK209-2-6]|uniref:ubiquinone anaerobic biosynthesis protein UbiV n=1 Tax=Roseobacter sp. SK209-2-6 TaxID=388739 RepID=UPI0000F3D7B3|nr:U32 family peptidase [Roseobacter sp. SK209-2-6]EBA17284.1 putative protease [Roseobacter sp. SK209-2-6]
MELTVAPSQFFWAAEEWERFYQDLATAPVERVVLGELVCSKRLPFYQDWIPAAVETLQSAGKEVLLTSLALITLKRERKQNAQLADMGVEIEINDLTALSYLPEGARFSVGPLINTYNESTLRWLASRGAARICLPPELPLDSVTALAKAGSECGVAVEVWGHGRIPLAISGRCYHARLHGRTKDNCQFACEDDPDGLEVRTLEGKPFLSMNGVQTLSDSYACADYQIEDLKAAGVSALRLSPQSKGFGEICTLYRQRLQGTLPVGTLSAKAIAQGEGIRLSDGFLKGETGVSWSGSQPAA